MVSRVRQRVESVNGFPLWIDPVRRLAKPYQDIILTQRRQRNLNDAVLFGCRVLESSHGLGKSDGHCEC